MASSRHAGLHRHLDNLEGRLPRHASHAVKWLRSASAWFRIPIALLLIAGGVFGFLPILGFWMIPLGLILLALDLPFLQRPLARLIDRLERWWTARSA